MKKVGLSIFVFALLLASALLLRNSGATSDGEIVIIVQDGEVVYEENVSFAEGQSLFELLDDSFTVTCANMNYKPSTDCVNIYGGSPVILGINDIMTDWTNSYFGIYINGEYSSFGINGIEFQDGDTILFEVNIVGGE